MENPCTSSFAKKKTWKGIFNTNSELLQNRTEKQVLLFRTEIYLMTHDII